MTLTDTAARLVSLLPGNSNAWPNELLDEFLYVGIGAYRMVFRQDEWAFKVVIDDEYPDMNMVECEAIINILEADILPAEYDIPETHLVWVGDIPVIAMRYVACGNDITNSRVPVQEIQDATTVADLYGDNIKHSKGTNYIIDLGHGLGSRYGNGPRY